MDYDPRTGEPILFELEHRRRTPGGTRWRSWLDWRSFGPLRPLWHLGPGFPLLAFGVNLLLGLATIPVLLKTEDPRARSQIFLLWLVVTTVLTLIQRSRARDYVTPTRLVRRHGLFGTARREILLSTIERVEFDYSPYWPAGESWDVGDVRVFSPGDVTTIAWVFEPDVAAKAILEAKGGTASGSRA
jgi:hypothetical protein